MYSTSYTPPHPIVLVCDYDNLDAVIPEYDPRSIISASDTCVSIRTISEIDGDVTVTLTQRLPPELVRGKIAAFSGAIDVPGRRIAVVTSENEKLLEVTVGGNRVALRIFVDQKKYPTAIWIEARDVIQAPKSPNRPGRTVI